MQGRLRSETLCSNERYACAPGIVSMLSVYQVDIAASFIVTVAMFRRHLQQLEPGNGWRGHERVLPVLLRFTNRTQVSGRAMPAARYCSIGCVSWACALSSQVSVQSSHSVHGCDSGNPFAPFEQTVIEILPLKPAESDSRQQDSQSPRAKHVAVLRYHRLCRRTTKELLICVERSKLRQPKIQAAGVIRLHVRRRGGLIRSHSSVVFDNDHVEDVDSSTDSAKSNGVCRCRIKPMPVGPEHGSAPDAPHPSIPLQLVCFPKRGGIHSHH